MSSQITSPNTEAAILARVFQVGEKELSRGAAEYLVSIRFGERDIARMNELSEVGSPRQIDEPRTSRTRQLSSCQQCPRCHAI